MFCRERKRSDMGRVYRVGLVGIGGGYVGLIG